MNKRLNHAIIPIINIVYYVILNELTTITITNRFEKNKKGKRNEMAEFRKFVESKWGS